MVSIRKRQWTSPQGKKQTGWVVDFRDGFGRRKAKQFRSQAEARKWVERSDLRSPETVSCRKTVADASQAWVERGEAEQLERSTLDQYRHVLNNHVRPYLGHVPLDQLTREQIVAFRKQLAEAKTPETARRAVHTLKMVLNYAVDSDWVARNVAWKLKSAPSARHRIAARKTNLRIPSLSDLREALKACDRRTQGGPPRMRQRTRVMLLVLIETAMRPSEARGLAWSHVRLHKREIEIAQRADRWGVIGPCKTVNGFRVVPISPRLASELQAWREACPASDRDLVFPTTRGKPLAHRNLGREWSKIQLAAGLTRCRSQLGGMQRLAPRYQLYDIRHFRASWWIYERIDLKSLTTRLGHSSIQVTFDIYGHVITDAEKDQVLATALEDVLYTEATPMQHEIPDTLKGDEKA